MRAFAVVLGSLLVAPLVSAQSTDGALLSKAGLKVVVLKSSESAVGHPKLARVGTIPVQPPGNKLFREERTTITATRTRPCKPEESNSAEVCTEFFLETFFVR